MMDTSKQPHQNDGKNDNSGVATTSLPKVGSPKTPVRRSLDDSLEDYDSDEMESPKFPHLLPVYNRRSSNDWDGVRIGWDDGYGSVCFEDDDYGAERNGKRFKRSRSGRLFTERHHQSLFKRNGNNSPSPSHGSNVNNAVIQAELNDYLGCILSCLSAKKKNRQLVKSKSETATSSNNLNENNNISNLLNDSTEDEMMIFCSQAIEKTIAFDANCNTVEPNKSVKSDSSSIVGISSLNTNKTTVNSNNYHQSVKKFKLEPQCRLINDKINKNFQSKCYTATSNTVNKPLKEINNCSLSTTNIVTNSNKDFFLNDSLANDDDLFSTLDLSAIEQQVLSDTKESTSVITQINDPACTKQHKYITTILNGGDGKNSSKSSTSNNSSSSVLWRRCSSSSSIVNKKLQFTQNNKLICGVTDTKVNSKTDVNAGSTRFCTPAEIEEKRNRARRTLMLKFKSKNKSAL